MKSEVFSNLSQFWIFQKIPKIKSKIKILLDEVLDKEFNNVLEQTLALHL